LDAPKKSDFDNEQEYKEAVRQWRKQLKKAKYLLELNGKILLFLEAPHHETFQMLLPILSHDREEIDYKITERTKRGSHNTSHIVLKGWPATIFCSTKEKFMEDFLTRNFVITPEKGTEKYREAHRVTAQRTSRPYLFDENRKEKVLIKTYIEDIFKNTMKEFSGVLIPYAEYLAEVYLAEIPRDMRDFGHFLDFLAVIAAFHFLQRPIVEMNKKKYVVATLQDFILARDIFFTIFETTRTGVQEHILNFYHCVLVKKKRWTIREATEAYNHAFRPKRSRKTVARYLQRLEDIGYLEEVDDENDRRLKIYVPMFSEQEKWTNLDFFQMSILTSPELKESLEKVVSEYGQQHDFHVYIYYVDDVGQVRKRELTRDELVDIIYTWKDDVCPYLKKQLEEWKRKKEAEILDNQEMSKNVHFSEETLSKLRRKIGAPCSQGDWIVIIKQLGFSENEAVALFDKLIVEGLIAETPEGLWFWVNSSLGGENAKCGSGSTARKENG